MAPSPQADQHREVRESHDRRDTAARRRERVDAKLDEALKATFPASDPFALTVGQDPNGRADDAFASVDEDPNSRATYASPPCFMHELDPSYLGLPPGRSSDVAEPANGREGASAKGRREKTPAPARSKKTAKR
jgi:hypothetical protein